MRLGAWDCKLAAGSIVADVYDAEMIRRHRRYEFNDSYRETLEKPDLKIRGPIQKRAW